MKKVIKKRVKTIKPRKGTEKNVKPLRVKTGVSIFDDLVQGGLKLGSINLIVGGPGSGKTIFAMQFLLEGIKQFNENGLYITFEERREKVIDDFKSFGYDLEKYEEEKKLTFLEYTPEQVKKMINEGGGTIESIIEKKNIQRIVIDSITSFSMLYKDDLEKKEASLALFEMINNWGCTAVLTNQMREIDEEIVSSDIEFESDSIILLYHTKRRDIRERALEILKMRGTKHPERLFPIEITNKGIVIHK